MATEPRHWERSGRTASLREPERPAFVDSLLRFWLGEGIVRRLRTPFSVAIVLGLGAIVLALGVDAVSDYGRDTFTLLDGGWRVLNGQRPHVDFYSALGPLYYLIVAAGLKLAHQSAVGLAYSTALFGTAIGLWTYFLARGRMAGFLATLVSIFAFFTAAAPYPLGDTLSDLSYAMQYNRFGYALLLLVLLERFTEPPPRSSSYRWLAALPGLSTGIACGCLLFLKVSYFGLLLVILAASAAMRRMNRRTWTGIAIGFALTSIVALAYLHFSLGSILQDMRMAAGARTSAHVFRKLPQLLTAELGGWLTVLIFALLGCALPPPIDARRTWLGRYALPLTALLFIAVEVGISLSNTQNFAPVLFTLYVALVVAHATVICRAEGLASKFSPLSYSSAIILAGTTVLITSLAYDANALLQVRHEQLQGPEPELSARIDAGPLQPLLFENFSQGSHQFRNEDNGRPLVHYINDGLQLLRQKSAPTDKVICLCFGNPFSFALQRPPSTGGSPLFAYGYNYTEHYIPSPARLVGDADVVMADKFYPNDDPSVLVKQATPELQAHFRRAGESEWWILYKRN